ncbi:Dabb family protein [Limnohabitans sp. Jir72]|uniref:Dabb family protein n=1 Tax=Limnohabitans sp. Jir72 TaxID=1977909 RepID=UPI000D3D4F64|nr:Dabb family protein [Limnohabitans sp. Jir72]PUE35815.1 stress responsive protein [Limnohabitans sp. Jir72]
MIRHIVMWNLQDHAEGTDKATNLDKAKALLLSCAQVVPGIQTFEVATAVPGMDCTNDLVLHMLVDDAQVLAAYQNHPQHLAIKPFMKAVVKERRCMDYPL